MTIKRWLAGGALLAAALPAAFGVVANDLGPDNLQAKHTAAMSSLAGDPDDGGQIAVLVALVRPGPQTTPPPAEQLMPKSATLQAAASDADPVPGPPDTPTVRG